MHSSEAGTQGGREERREADREGGREGRSPANVQGRAFHAVDVQRRDAGVAEACACVEERPGSQWGCWGERECARREGQTAESPRAEGGLAMKLSTSAQPPCETLHLIFLGSSQIIEARLTWLAGR